MIRRPHPGQLVTLRYSPPRRRLAPGLHLATGEVVAAARGPGPRNALVRLDGGRLVVVGGGNLFAREPKRD